MKLRLLLQALVLVAAASVAGDPDSIRVLYPPPGAILDSSPTLVMILGPDAAEPPPFRLDDEPLLVEKITFDESWHALPPKIRVPVGSDDLPLRSPLLADKAGKAIWIAVETISGGEHAVTLHGVTLAAFSSRAPGQTDTAAGDAPILRVHASPTSTAEARDCGQCHEDPGGSRVLGLAPVPRTCHSCHAEVNLAVTHEHVMEFLARCQMCHDPHASTRSHLLIDTRERLCALCHEYGHSM